MSRPLRIDVEGGWYHITARGHNREALFLDDRDRNHLVALLAEGVERFQVELRSTGSKVNGVRARHYD